MVKRTLDLALVLPALILASPLMLVIAVAIRCSSPGPVIFRQVRVGRYGKHFNILKFRTMVPKASTRGPAITVGHDPRITVVGRFLRRHKLDELPQLVNVLLGDMSIVGPRPELARFVEHYPKETADRVLSVRPGLTDLASIEFIDEDYLLTHCTDPERAYLELIVPRKLKYYEDYVARSSIWLDIQIIGRTLAKLVKR